MHSISEYICWLYRYKQRIFQTWVSVQRNPIWIVLHGAGSDQEDPQTVRPDRFLMLQTGFTKKFLKLKIVVTCYNRGIMAIYIIIYTYPMVH